VSDDVTRLLALVADTVLLAGAVTAQVTDLAAVVALLALGAVARHVAVASAREASLGSTAGSSTVATLASAVAGSSAVPGNVANLAALVALSTAGSTAASSTVASTVARSTTSGARAVTRDVASLTAPVARLLLRWRSAVTAQMTILAAVVADRVSTLWALPRLMSNLVAVVASTASGSLVGSSEIHYVD